MRCRRWLGTLLPLGLALAAGPGWMGGAGGRSTPGRARHQGHCRVVGGTADLSQAFLMLDLLEELNKGGKPWALVDAVLASPGTALVIEQLNLARRVSAAQYGMMLRAVVNGVEPDIPPADTTSRAMAGVAGLHDAYDRLRWAAERVDELRAHLESLRGLDIAEHACAKAFDNLPRPVDVDVSASVVVGGRAGAAALSPGSIYVDVGVSDRVARRRGEARAPDQMILDFFAHEIHHIALGKTLEERRVGLTLAGPDLYAARVLNELVLEGSATYLIDFDGDLEAHLHDQNFESEFADIGALLGLVEGVISRIFAEDVSTDAGFDEVASEIIGNRYHAAGAYLFATIDHARGRNAIMRVMEDPRMLFAEYEAAVSDGADPDAPRLDAALAKRLAEMGS